MAYEPIRLRTMRIWFREGFYGGLSVALLIAFFLTWLWQPEHQVRRHTENLLHAIAKKDWTRFAAFIGSDYQDQWGNDRALVLERTREVFRYLRNVRIGAVGVNLRIDKGSALWRAKITVDGDGELMALLKERVNSLATPFQLEWRHVSAEPWNWKLVRVSHAELEIPSGIPMNDRRYTRSQVRVRCLRLDANGEVSAKVGKRVSSRAESLWLRLKQPPLQLYFPRAFRN